MNTRVKGSSFRTVDNFGFVSLADIATAGTDATAVIVATLAAGTPLFIPVGTWLYSTFTVPSGAIIFGVGLKSILKQKDLSNTAGIICSGDGIQLSNFLVDGNKVNQVGAGGFHGITFNGCTDLQAHRIFTINAKGSNFRITGAASNEVNLIDCVSTGQTESGFLVDSGSNISLINPRAMASDAVATGDGISIASNGLSISNLLIDSPIVKNQTVRGIALVGNGSKNVLNVSITNPRVSNNLNSGLFLTNVDGASIGGGLSYANGIDGLRVEGDVQNGRFSELICRANAAYGMREVTLGSTPNFNGFIYGVSTGNSNNAITKVGASSYVVN